MKLHYAGYQPNASGFGWATANANLHRELSEHCEMIDIATGKFHSEIDIAFIPLADHDFNPVSPARGKVNLAYTFFEFPLGPHAAENAKKYNTVFAGSTWCLERMAEVGITNGKLLIQGVDQTIFYPQPRKPDGTFSIFSGGKFEVRKGQDLVIAAFKEFKKRHKDAHLVCAWHNPWPQLIPGMPMGANQLEYIESLFKANGIMTYHLFGSVSQERLAAAMASTDVGLFPNRCEGGTNLVLMEYASCGRKIVANAKTGHADVNEAITYEIPATTDENHWAVQNVDDIVAALEWAYENRDNSGLAAPAWTWGRAAETIIAEAQRFL